MGMRMAVERSLLSNWIGVVSSSVVAWHHTCRWNVLGWRQQGSGWRLAFLQSAWVKVLIPIKIQAAGRRQLLLQRRFGAELKNCQKLPICCWTTTCLLRKQDSKRLQQKRLRTQSSARNPCNVIIVAPGMPRVPGCRWRPKRNSLYTMVHVLDRNLVLIATRLVLNGQASPTVSTFAPSVQAGTGASECI